MLAYLFEVLEKLDNTVDVLAAVGGEDGILSSQELDLLGQSVTVMLHVHVDVFHVVLLEGRAPVLHRVDQPDVVVFQAVSAEKPPATIQLNKAFFQTCSLCCRRRSRLCFQSVHLKLCFTKNMKRCVQGGRSRPFRHNPNKN